MQPGTAFGWSSKADGAWKGGRRVPAGTSLFDGQQAGNSAYADSGLSPHVGGARSTATCKNVQGARGDGRAGDRRVDPRASRGGVRRVECFDCRAQAPKNSSRVKPLQTRPKAALAGVGRHVDPQARRPEALPELTETKARRSDLRFEAVCRQWTMSSRGSA